MSDIHSEIASARGYGYDTLKAQGNNLTSRVTVQDMINSTKKCTTSWGIEGYTINANGGPLPANPKYSFPKLKKDFKPTSQVTYEAYPGAPTYHKEPSWNKANGKIHDGKRVLFIEKDANFNSYKPAPNAYNPVEVRAHTKFIPFSKGQRVNFLCDAEFLGTVNPGAGKYEPSHKQTKVRSSEFKYYASKEDRTKWKPVKTALPDCALYKIEPADKHVFKQAPRNAKVMANPVTFSEYHAKLTKVVPGAGTYDPEKSYKKLYKPMRKW